MTDQSIFRLVFVAELYSKQIVKKTQNIYSFINEFLTKWSSVSFNQDLPYSESQIYAHHIYNVQDLCFLGITRSLKLFQRPFYL